MPNTTRYQATRNSHTHEETPTFGNDLVAVTRETAAMVSASSMRSRQGRTMLGRTTFWMSASDVKYAP